MSYSSPGYTTEKMHFFISDEIEVSEKERDEEAIEVFEMTLEEMKEKIDSLEIKDAKTIMAYFLAKEYIDENN